MTTYTNFKIYTPEVLEDPELGIGYLMSDEGVDWYESQVKFSEKTMKIAYDARGIVRSYDQDVSRLWPVNLSVSEVKTSAIPEGFNLSGAWVFDGKKISPYQPTKDELIAKAEQDKLKLMAAANAAIAPMQDAVKYGMATDAESALLIEWEKYRVLLYRIDPSKAPDIEWPPVPVSE